VGSEGSRGPRPLKAEHGCEEVMIDRTLVMVRFIARKKLAPTLEPL